MRSLLKRVKGSLPESAGTWIKRLKRPRLTYLPFRRLSPAGRGYDRGQPIDRFFIEGFLEENRKYIRGLTLEVKDDSYTRRFGADAVTRCDILDIDPNNPKATIVGDLRSIPAIASDTYDTIVLTQVLQYIDDLHPAVAELHRVLKPGGNLLITVPFLMLQDPRAIDFWRFTPHSIKYLLGPHFPEQNLDIQSRGNMLTGVAFWMGLAAEELRASQLAHQDPLYGCVITARATKALANGRVAGA